MSFPPSPTRALVALVALVSLAGCGPKANRVDDAPWVPGHTCVVSRVNAHGQREESRIERDRYGRITRFELLRNGQSDAWFFGFRRKFGPGRRIVESQVEATGDDVIREWVTYRLDEVDRVVAESGPDGYVEYRYNEEGQLAEARNVTQQRRHRYVYEGDRRLDVLVGSLSAEPTTMTTVLFDERGSVVEEISPAMDSAPERRRLYERDARGALSRIVETEGGHTVAQERCSTDSRGRLRECVSVTAAGRAMQAHTSYRYDHYYGDHPCLPEALPTAYRVER